MLNKFRIRFEELEEQLIKIESTKKIKQDSAFVEKPLIVDNELFTEWITKAKNLILNACA